MYPVIFTQAAPAELIEAQDWHERRSTGLGRRFNEVTEPVVQRMPENPRQFPVLYKTVRRALLRRFPYSLSFTIEEDGVLFVIACFSRQPRPGPLAEAGVGAALVPARSELKAVATCSRPACFEPAPAGERGAS